VKADGDWIFAVRGTASAVVWVLHNNFLKTADNRVFAGQNPHSGSRMGFEKFGG